uniref:Putative cytochrome c oxidase polypeptide viii n=1 Tax=Tabanus bromius TaxID=304241 RepID=A0A0K8TQN8_TABBR
MMRNFASRLLAPSARAALMPSRAMSVVSGPSTVRVSKLEKYFLAAIWISGISVIPAWVLTHIKEYKGPK